MKLQIKEHKPAEKISIGHIVELVRADTHKNGIVLLNRWLLAEQNILRRERKSALRECGRLGDKLHVTRLVIENLRAENKKLAEIVTTLQKEGYEE